MERQESAQHIAQHQDEEVHLDERERHDSSDVNGKDVFFISQRITDIFSTIERIFIFMILISALVEQEQQRIERMAADWDDDPTSVDWGVIDESHETTEMDISGLNSSAQVPQIFKCTALYSYMVWY